MRINELSTETFNQLDGRSWTELQELAQKIGVTVRSSDRGRPTTAEVRRAIEKHIGIYGTWKRPNTLPMPNDMDRIPMCPRCGRVMIEKTNRTTTQKFWGCPSYPSCKGTRPNTWTPDNDNTEPADDFQEYPVTLYCPTNPEHPPVAKTSASDTWADECGICGATMTRTPPQPDTQPVPNTEYVTQLEAEVLELTERAESAEATIKTMLPTEPSTTRDTHYQFPKVYSALRAGVNAVYMSGQPGVGKTEIAQDVADAFGVECIVQTCYAQMSEVKLYGFIDANGNYHRTPLRQACEHGGVYVLDEMDNGNSNLLASLNSLLSNKRMPVTFPDARIERHPDFYVIATANTWGNGPTAEFMGRTHIDRATMDRLTKIGIEIDTALERNIMRTLIHEDTAETILTAVQTIRERVGAEGLRIVTSPRMSFQVAQLMHTGEWTMREAFETTSLATVSPEKFSDLTRGIEGMI